MHESFMELQNRLSDEQSRNAKMQMLLLEMLNKVQQVVGQQAEASCRVLGDLRSTCAGFHNRCLPKHVRKSLNTGIAAVKHRAKRNKLQDKENIGRLEAEEKMKENRMQDLDVWQDCVPKKKKIDIKTARSCRAKTRQLTTRIREANLESEGAKKPLTIIKDIPLKKRDATAEVGKQIMRTCVCCLYSLIYVCFCRKNNIWWTKLKRSKKRVASSG